MAPKGGTKRRKKITDDTEGTGRQATRTTWGPLAWLSPCHPCSLPVVVVGHLDYAGWGNNIREGKRHANAHVARAPLHVVSAIRGDAKRLQMLQMERK